MHSVFGKINYDGLKHNSLYLGLVLPSGGRQSLIGMINIAEQNSRKMTITFISFIEGVLGIFLGFGFILIMEIFFFCFKYHEQELFLKSKTHLGKL